MGSTLKRTADVLNIWQNICMSDWVLFAMQITWVRWWLKYTFSFFSKWNLSNIKCNKCLVYHLEQRVASWPTNIMAGQSWIRLQLNQCTSWNWFKPYFKGNTWWEMFFTTLDILKEDGLMHMYTPIRTSLLFFLFTMFYFIVSRKQRNRVITTRQI